MQNLEISPRGRPGGDFRCCECGAASRIIEARLIKPGLLKRRHECIREHRFTTYQLVVRTPQDFAKMLEAAAA